MVVTEIKPRRKGLVCVIADGEEFLLDADTVLSAGVTEKSELTRKDLEKLIVLSEGNRAKSRALWYLSRADLTHRALSDKLRRTFSNEAVEYAVARMEELGLIDDTAYAKRLSQMYSEQNLSNKEILQKLFVKGVPSDISHEAVAELSTDAASQIENLLNTKYASRLKSEDGVQKVYAALIRKGFSYSDVRSALKSYSENLENSEEF